MSESQMAEREETGDRPQGAGILPPVPFFDADAVPADTIRGFKEIVEGKHDEIPEQDFYMAGGIEDVLAKFSARK